MKIVFEGPDLNSLFAQISHFIDNVVNTKKIKVPGMSEKAKATAIPSEEAEGPGPDVFAEAETPVDKPEDNPVDKPAKAVDPRVAKMQAAKAAKKAEREAAEKPAPATKKAAAPMDPAEVVKLRQKTIEDLQQAYANGHQKEVFELLSRFGNGAKSFRELPPDAFLPIREAIDNGALT